MTRTIESIIESLTAFAPSRDDDENVRRLYAILDGFDQLADRTRAAPAMFDLIERCPNNYLGSPGPLVHALETLPNHPNRVRESLRRRPTEVAIWMANRILNSQLQPGERAEWIAALRAVGRHPLATDGEKKSAQLFLEYQSEREPSGNGV